MVDCVLQLMFGEFTETGFESHFWSLSILSLSLRLSVVEVGGSLGGSLMTMAGV